MSRREELRHRTTTERCPGGLVMELYVDGALRNVSKASTVQEADDAAKAGIYALMPGNHYEVLVFDGDSGLLILRLGDEPLDDVSVKLDLEDI